MKISFERNPVTYFCFSFSITKEKTAWVITPWFRLDINKHGKN